MRNRSRTLDDGQSSVGLRSDEQARQNGRLGEMVFTRARPDWPVTIPHTAPLTPTSPPWASILATLITDKVCDRTLSVNQPDSVCTTSSDIVVCRYRGNAKADCRIAGGCTLTRRGIARKRA